MINDNSIKGILLGFLSYFVISIVLELIGIEKLFFKYIITGVVLVLAYLIIKLRKKK